MKKSKMDDFELKRFMNEIEILKKLDHPNVLKLYEFYEDKKRFYLVLELCSGGELYDTLTEKG